MVKLIVFNSYFLIYKNKLLCTTKNNLPLCALIFLFFNTFNKVLAQQPTCNGWKISLNQANNVSCFSQEIPIRLSNDAVPQGGTVIVQKLLIEGELVIPGTSSPAEADISSSSGSLGGIFGGIIVISPNTTNGKRTKFLINFENFNPPISVIYPDNLATLRVTAPAGISYQIKVSKFQIQTTSNTVLCEKSNLVTAAISQPAPVSTATDVRIFADVNNAIPIGNSTLKIPIKIKQTIGTNGSNSFQNIAFKIKLIDEFNNLALMVPTPFNSSLFNISLSNQIFIIGQSTQPFGISGINNIDGKTLGFVNVEVKNGLPIQAGKICLQFEWVMIEETLSAGPSNGQTVCSSVLPTNNNECKQVGTGNLGKIMSSSQSATGINIKTIPNPFEKNLSLELEVAAAMTVNLQVFDMMGRLILQQKADCLKGVNAIELNDVGRLPKGNYTIIIENDLTKEQFFTKIPKM